MTASSQLEHVWCNHCHQSLCGLSSEGGFEPILDQIGSGDEGLDCIVCADLSWVATRKARCLRIVAA